MKQLIFILISLLFSGCVPSYFMTFVNDTNEPIYVYETVENSLPKTDELFFEYYSKEQDTILLGSNKLYTKIVPCIEWTVDVQNTLPPILELFGIRNMSFGPEGKRNFFIISEETIENYTWEEIYKNQMYEEKITLYDKDLKENRCRYVYNPKKSKL